MKGITGVLAALLLGYQVAGFGHDGHHALRVRDVVTEPEPLTIEVTVYVDQNGKTLGTQRKGHHPSTTVNSAPTDLPPIIGVPNLDIPNELVPTLATDVANHNPQQSQPQPQPQNGRRFGISYSPYNADNTCKSQDQVNSDMDTLGRYAFVRIYGVDCDQTNKVVSAARQRNLKVFTGVYDLQNLDASLKLISDAAAGDWTTIHTVSVGNELINRGQNSVPDVTNAVRSARTYLRNAGYKGPVVTIDTFSKMLEHPELCQASDYCAANCHAFFDNAQTAEQAGEYVRRQAHDISAAAGGKRTMISESGWPHAGQVNGAAVPSPENQQRAIESLRQAFAHNHGNLVLFSAFDDAWKQDSPGTFGAEKFWGIERH
ncbi:hypothetical protein AOCH_003057 [Aspergillus ochraceoroseus]|nr:hypothetical protein AOCH_003057 [Aspergillus ochraceoroseus]